MASSSMIAHRLRPSKFSASSSVDGLPEPTWSTGLPLPDGLAPHPLVHTPAFLSTSPPPLISGLERHPDAPKPFSPSLFFRPEIADPPEPQFEDENLLSESSLFPINETDSSAFFKAPDGTTTTSTTLSSRSSRFLSRSPSNPPNYTPNPIPALCESSFFDQYELYPAPTVSSLSAGSSTESEDSNPSVLSENEVDGDDAAYDGDDDRSCYAFRRSPMSRPRKTLQPHQPQLHLQVQVMPVLDATTAPSPHSQCGDSGFGVTRTHSAFSEFTNYVAGGLSRLVSSATAAASKSPASAAPGALSRLLMEYLRAS